MSVPLHKRSENKLDAYVKTLAMVKYTMQRLKSGTARSGTNKKVILSRLKQRYIAKNKLSNSRVKGDNYYARA